MTLYCMLACYASIGTLLYMNGPQNSISMHHYKNFEGEPL